MNSLHREYVLAGCLAIAVIAYSIASPSLIGYAVMVLAVTFASCLFLTGNRPDRGFFLAGSGVILVAASGLMNAWFGLAISWVIALIVMSGTGVLESREDLRLFGYFCAVTFALAGIIDLSNHVTIPILIIGGIFAACLAVMEIQQYRMRKHYSGVKS